LGIEASVKTLDIVGKSLEFPGGNDTRIISDARFERDTGRHAWVVVITVKKDGTPDLTGFIEFSHETYEDVTRRPTGDLASAILEALQARVARYGLDADFALHASWDSAAESLSLD
jgi:hypothetical protein